MVVVNLHITTKWVSSLTLDCNGVFAIKAYGCPMMTTKDTRTKVRSSGGLSGRSASERERERSKQSKGSSMFDLISYGCGGRASKNPLALFFFFSAEQRFLPHRRTLESLEWKVESTTVTHSSADWWGILLPLA